MINFREKLATRQTNKPVEPIELYATLDRKSVAGPLRPTQEHILNDWYHNRSNDRDLIIKLHTGEGKTLVGLLILQSKINSGNGPCLYLCPNKYLAKQACGEAEKFGIPYCEIQDDKQIPDEFLSCEKILITYAHKAFNGKSIFGINNRSVNVGVIVLDDAHACIDIIKSASTITIEKKYYENLYSKFLTLFSDSLYNQGEGSFTDIENGDYSTSMIVPYWDWEAKKQEVLNILSKDANDTDTIKYAWPLIRDKLSECACYISGQKIEIAPYNPSVEPFGVFSKAKQRILMSATTQDDSFFIKGLLFNEHAVQQPLAVNEQKWSGEKMIIIPTQIDDDCSRDIVITFLAKKGKLNWGRAAIVTSVNNAMQYKNNGAIISTSESIFNDINNLKKNDYESMIVFVNRYDGIDLPDENCRVLIIDGLPYFDNLSDRYELSCRPNSDIINKKIAQKIEQGIGRGVRGEKDYCAILILGADLVKFIRSKTTNCFFSEQTKKQIEIGLEIAKMAQEDCGIDVETLAPIKSLIRQMLKRDEGWKEYYQSEMNTIESNSNPKSIYERLVDELEIEKLYSDKKIEAACDKLQKYIDNYVTDEVEKGWFMQQLARYTYHISKKKAMQIQLSAFSKNHQLLKPIEGVTYQQISYVSENRVKRIKNQLLKYADFNELIMDVHEKMEMLSFGVEAEKFEHSLWSIGELLGFVSQRPDKDIRTGPDNLWCGERNHFLLFECKSEVNESRTEINKQEVGQMNNHCAWFEENYKDANVDRFLIIPTIRLAECANFSHKVLIIRKNRLNILKQNIVGFIKEFKTLILSDIQDDEITKFLAIHKLNAQDFASEYGEEYKRKNN